MTERVNSAVDRDRQCRNLSYERNRDSYIAAADIADHRCGRSFNKRSIRKVVGMGTILRSGDRQAAPFVPIPTTTSNNQKLRFDKGET